MQPVLTEDRVGSFRIWDQPKDNMEYVAGIDPAENKQRDRGALQRRAILAHLDARPDYCAIVVLEMESGLHVATWHGYCSPDELATISAAIGYYYNGALLVPEINGPGLAVVTRLSDTIRYDNLYRTTIYNVLDRDPLLPQWGWRTDSHSRPILMLRVHEALNSGNLWTRDADLVNELRTMEFDEKGEPRARGKNKDDRVFALALALQGRFQSVGQGPIRRATPGEGPERDYDRKVWDHIKKKQENSKHGNRTGRDGVGRGNRGDWVGRSRPKVT